MRSMQKLTHRTARAVLTAAAVCLFFSGFALAHGPGGHGESSFTALQALDKGVTLYDKLVASGKLEESWETGLQRVDIDKRGNEYVVSFSRSDGDPDSLYIFFDENGEYTGSNFTGQ